MKKIIITPILICILFLTELYAQQRANLPELITVSPYRLEVGYNTTTVIIFPVPLIPAADRGNREILVQMEKQVENVLKVKAAKKDFQPTNLHVYTTDGKVYVFNVNYVEYPGSATFLLTIPANENTATAPLILNNNIIDKTKLHEIAQRARLAKNFFSKKKIRHGIKLQLQSIHIFNDWLLFGFLAGNHSNLNFDIDFVRMYIRDKQKIKRSSVQEQELTPVFKDNLQEVGGWRENRFVIAVPKFTIPDNKEFVIELYERSGGRHITLKIKNRHLLRAKHL